jgi:hypothetical protein
MSVKVAAHERELSDADAALAIAPGDVAARLARARALYALGRDTDALQAYLDVLRIDPARTVALTSLATLAIKTGHREAARTALTQAVRVRPDSAEAHANLATLLSDDGDFVAAREHYDEALRLDPHQRDAHRGLAVLLLRLGDDEGARKYADLGLLGRAEEWPYRGTGKPISVLLVLSALGCNAPIEQFLDDRVFSKWTLVPEFFDARAKMPPHDVLFHCVGDADRGASAIDAAEALVAHSTSPLLNPPSRVRQTSRSAVAERLRPVPGVVTPRIAEWSRDALSAPEAPGALAEGGFTWPLLLRSPGFHAGAHFVKVDDPSSLGRAVENLPGTTLLVIQFLDTRGRDGKFRKYRVMMVGGRLYPLHLAVSANWKVHYFSADMADRPEHRAEDEAFLRDMPGVFGLETTQALERVRELLALDYGGIDFTLDAHRRVVVFEANAAMAVVAPGEHERWAYRIAPVRRIHDAVHRMLLTTAGRTGEGVQSNNVMPGPC